MRNPGYLLVLSAILVPVATSQPKVISLNEAMQIALERNLNVIQTQNSLDGASGQVLAAYGAYLPSLSATGSWGRSQSQRTGDVEQIIEGTRFTIPTESFSVSNSFSTTLSTSLTLFDGLSREANVSASLSRKVSAEKTVKRTRQAIAYQAAAGYVNVFRTRELVGVSEENLKRDQRQLERITESNRVGALSLADVYRQQAQVANDELNLINAQNNYEKAKADLVALVGLDPRQEYEFQDPAVKTEMDSAEVTRTMSRYSDRSGLTDYALSSRPDYTVAMENLNAAASGVQSARAGYFPSVSASASLNNFNNELDRLRLNKNYSLSWGIGLRWNLFDRFLTNQQIQNATVNKRNAEIELAQTERDISVEVKKAMLDLEAARKSWEASEKALFSATEDRKIAEERYNLGAGTLLDLLVANATYVSAQATRVNSITGFLVAKYNVEFVLAEKAY